MKTLMTTIHQEPFRTSLRLWIVAILLTVLGFAIVAEYTRDVSYSDGIVRTRVAEVEAHGTDKDVALQPFAMPVCVPLHSFIIIPLLHFASLQFVDFLSYRVSLGQSLHLRGPPI